MHKRTRGVQEHIPCAADSIPTMAEVGTICGCTWISIIIDMAWLCKEPVVVHLAIKFEAEHIAVATYATTVCKESGWLTEQY